MKQSKSGTLSASMTSSDSGVSGLQNGPPPAQAPSADAVDAHSSTQAADGPVLARNMGIPVVVVVTKVRARPQYATHAHVASGIALPTEESDAQSTLHSTLL